MFRSLVRASAKAPRHRRAPLIKSAVSRSAGASTVLTESLFGRPLAGPSVSEATFHTSAPTYKSAAGVTKNEKPPFEVLMAANRGEIATRIVRAASELGIKTAGIYAHEGRLYIMLK
jgi:Biotin carboxylase, N-terminal domain